VIFIFWVIGTLAHAENSNSPLFVTGSPTHHEFLTEATGYGALSEGRSQVAAYFSSADSRSIKIGTRVHVKLLPSETNVVEVLGKVKEILHNADPRTGQSIVTISIPSQKIPARSYVFVRIPISSRSSLALPTTAIIVDGGHSYVYKEKTKGDYEKTRVEVGNQEPDFTEIKGGIGPNDIVLTEGALEWARKDVTGGGD
jgi:multidrug efflux pump subunit AcrA (membrane-fusion protein)